MRKQKNSISLADKTMQRCGFVRAAIEGVRVACGTGVRVYVPQASGKYAKLARACFVEMPRLLYGKLYVRAIKTYIDGGYNIVEAMDKEAEHIKEAMNVAFFNALEQKLYNRGPISVIWNGDQVTFKDNEDDSITIGI